MKNLELALRLRLGEPAILPGGKLEFECPRCGRGKRKLGVNIQKKLFHCFRCKWGGMLVDLLREIDVDLDMATSDSPWDHKIEPKKSVPDHIPGFTQDGDECARAATYAIGRGRLSTFMDVIRRGWGVSTEPKLAGRLIVPLHVDGRLVQYIARSISPELQPKEKGGPRKSVV